MFIIACTDLDWFDQLKTRSGGGTVNFWTPTPWNVKALSAGDRLYFMLKAPVRKIGGHGRFATFREMTVSNAWRAYGLNNGVGSRSELVEKISRYVTKTTGSVPGDDPTIGCIELTEAVFLDDSDYFDPERYGFSFPKTIVMFKKFEASSIPFATDALNTSTQFNLISSARTRKTQVSTKDRQGQSAFRTQVLKAYNQRCCITGERIPELLQAAHIQPYLSRASNHIQNSLCLRIDIHWLFDRGLISVSDELKVTASDRLLGSSYEALNGQPIQLPNDPAQRPSFEALRYHRREVFS